MFQTACCVVTNLYCRFLETRVSPRSVLLQLFYCAIPFKIVAPIVLGCKIVKAILDYFRVIELEEAQL